MMPLASMIATWTMISLSTSVVLTMVWKSDVILPSFDGAAQVEQRLVDLADRAQHVLLEHHREILVGALGVSQIAAIVFIIFQRYAAPKHRNDNNTEDRRRTALLEQSRKLGDVKRHAFDGLWSNAVSVAKLQLGLANRARIPEGCLKHGKCDRQGQPAWVGQPIGMARCTSFQSPRICGSENRGPTI